MGDNVLELTKLETYLVKNHRQDLINEVNRINSKEELEAKMLRVAKHAQEITDAQKEDEALQEAKQKAKDLNAPYAESKRMNAKIARFLSLKAKERGYE